LIIKEDKDAHVLEVSKQEALTTAFKSQLPNINKVEFNVMVQSMGENASPVVITQSEYMRRMKEMANIQAGNKQPGNNKWSADNKQPGNNR
jgi:molecular chaperone HtpG